MRKSIIIKISALVVVCLVAAIVLRSATKPAQAPCSKESMEDCCKQKSSTEGSTILEKITTEFISVSN